MPTLPLMDLTGQRYGRLTVVDEAPVSITNGRKSRRWNCVCDCGNTTVVRQGDIRQGKTVSCGCYHLETISADYDTDSPEWTAWQNMKRRCDPNGSRKNEVTWRRKGIKVCDEWLHDFMAFFDHIGKRPSANHSVDRIDNTKDYQPGNVRWATASEQVENRDVTKRLTFNGDTLTITQWAKKTGLQRRQIYARIFVEGWSIAEALTTPPLSRAEVNRRRAKATRAPRG